MAPDQDHCGNETETAPTPRLRPAVVLYTCVMLTAIHSIVLGGCIYLFTEQFYERAFRAPIENFFFVRQAGVFLLCLGLFYLYPLINLQRYHRLVMMAAVTKVIAVAFLLTNRQQCVSPASIDAAMLVDGFMAVVLIGTYATCRAKGALQTDRPRESTHDRDR